MGQSMVLWRIPGGQILPSGVFGQSLHSFFPFYGMAAGEVPPTILYLSCRSSPLGRSYVLLPEPIEPAHRAAPMAESSGADSHPAPAPLPYEPLYPGQAFQHANCGPGMLPAFVAILQHAAFFRTFPFNTRVPAILKACCYLFFRCSSAGGGVDELHPLGGGAKHHRVVVPGGLTPPRAPPPVPAKSSPRPELGEHQNRGVVLCY